MASFDALPDELITHILHYTSPEETLLQISRVSKRFARVAQTPLLWRYYCDTTFKYWQADHAFHAKRRNRRLQIDWRRLCTLRLFRNRRITQLLDGIVATRLERLQRIEEICQYGYDAKDYLLSQCKIDDDAPDVLARRYYACTVLDSIHRSLAIAEWAKYQKHAARQIRQGAPPSEKINCGMRLERALGAFDMFVLHDNEGDLDEISAILDQLAARFRRETPNVDEMTTRQKSMALSKWLHASNLTAAQEDERMAKYLRTCLIGRALQDDQHPSMPIISAAIFSSIAERFNVEAYCCLLPTQIYIVVLSPQGVSLDGHPIPRDEEQQQKMFIDSYGSDGEVSLDALRVFLNRLGAHSGHSNLLGPTSTDLIVMRTAQNIRSSFTSFRTLERPVADLVPLIELRHGDWARNLQPALYSMIWASIMMVPILPDNEDMRWDWQQDVRDLLQYFYEYFPEDSWLVEKYVCPMYDTFAAPGRRQNNWELPSRRVRDQIREIRRVDSSEKAPWRRSTLDNPSRVKYRIGQVFKHKRYDYHGIIIGWTVNGAGFDDNSSRAECRVSQPFYRCMVGTDGSDHHVIAEDNMEVLNLQGGVRELPREIRDLVPMAGKFFKRWDDENGVFVSNLRELFPED
ncbi:hypothetical protein PGQ11_001128 [Apiospora arundinis]|uniref:F-box domain-containing protein n=1 Tax=Apiospora arundinis TaxID=335852 RepID=A0ABR2JM81_9PEZI